MRLLVGFVAAFLTATAAFGQTVSEQSVPPRLASFVCVGCWLCDGEVYSDVVMGYGETCAAAELDCEQKLDDIHPGSCSPGNSVPIKNLFDCEMETNAVAELQSGVATGDWTVRLTYSFCNGERLSRTSSGCNYCEAHKKAWEGILRLASRKRGVCPCTGKCEIVKRPTEQCGCQSNPCRHTNRQRLRVRCR